MIDQGQVMGTGHRMLDIKSAKLEWLSIASECKACCLPIMVTLISIDDFAGRTTIMESLPKNGLEN